MSPGLHAPPGLNGFWRTVLILWGICLLSACSSFDARWKAAAASQDTSRWDGRWTSEKHRTRTGAPMGGRLRAVIAPAPQGALTAFFKANWLIFASDYSINLEPKTVGSRPTPTHRFSGTHELPKMFGGTYRYEATMEGDHFEARYTSSYDHGTFTLQRVPVAKDYGPTHARH